MDDRNRNGRALQERSDRLLWRYGLESQRANVSRQLTILDCLEQVD